MCQSILGSGKGLLHEQFSVTFDKREALCILMQYEVNWCIHLVQYLEIIFFHKLIMIRKPGTDRQFFTSANSL